MKKTKHVFCFIIQKTQILIPLLVSISWQFGIQNTFLKSVIIFLPFLILDFLVDGVCAADW